MSCGRCGEKGHTATTCPYGSSGTAVRPRTVRKPTGEALGSILFEELRPFGLVDPYDMRAPAHKGSGVPMAGLREALDRAAQRIYEYMTRDD